MTLEVFNILAYVSELEYLNQSVFFLDASFNDQLSLIRLRNFSYQLQNGPSSEATWFDLFPNVVQSKMLRMMNHWSLINFSRAYPKYTTIVLDPKYWQKIELEFQKTYVSEEELVFLLKFLGEHLKEISIDLISYGIFGSKSPLVAQLENLKKLKRLNIIYNDSLNIISIICVNINNIQQLIIYWEHLSNQDLIEITTALTNLSSLVIKRKRNTGTDLSLGLKYFINRVHSLKRFGVQNFTVDDGVFESLVDRHKIWLKELEINLDCTLFPYSILKPCNNVTVLNLYDAELHSELSEYLDLLDNLECLKLFNKRRILLYKLFTKPKPYLKRLWLANISLKSDIFEAIVKLSPNIHKLSLYNCGLSDECLKDNVKNLGNLAYLRFSQEQNKQGVSTYEFLCSISKQVLPKLKTVCIITQSSFYEKMVKL